ncbi:hypothetical protein THRCLA_00311 [Thraustotheca clavata]|uniref:Uncharacterized protein n=1 Tax=Thraustotheca clavata TaxID=74557 RepID=A0A1W0ABP0_9STRA|nr:hypothetical protein THRCLA_00311 [Thraustotheca clavata]
MTHLLQWEIQIENFANGLKAYFRPELFYFPKNLCSQSLCSCLNIKPLSLLGNDEAVDLWTPLDNADYLTPSLWGTNDGWTRSNAMNIAAVLGDLDTVKLLHRTQIKCCTTEAMDKAAGIGRLDIVKWPHTQRTEGCTNNAMTYAIAGGHLNIVKWLHEIRCLFGAKNGNIGMVKYLISISEIVRPDDILVGVALNGHIKVVQMLKDYPATTIQ